jgi:hypothetical protein
LSHAAEPAPLALRLDAEALRPLITEIVEQTVNRLKAEAKDRADGPLCYSEEEAARLLGVNAHVLRDERRRGRIQASQVVGRRIRYIRADLLAYLQARRVGA